MTYRLSGRTPWLSRPAPWCLLLVLVALPWGVVRSADHRDSPLSSEDPAADINDVYVFVSPTDSTKVIFAMTVNGFAVPAVRSSYSFGTDVLYQFKIDNDRRRPRKTWSSRRPSTASSRCATRAARATGGGQFVTVIGPGKPANVGADNHLVRRNGPEVSGLHEHRARRATASASWAGLADDPFVVDIGQLNRILGGAQDVFRGATSPVARARSAAGRSATTTPAAWTASAGSTPRPSWSRCRSRPPPRSARGGNRPASAGRSRRSTGATSATTPPSACGARRAARRSCTAVHPARAARLGPYVQVQRMGHQVFKTIFLPDRGQGSVQPLGAGRRRRQRQPVHPRRADHDRQRRHRQHDRGPGRGAGRRSASPRCPTACRCCCRPSFGNTDPNLIRKVLIPDVLRINLALPATDVGVATNGLQNGRRFGDDVIDILLRLSRQLADVKFPDRQRRAGQRGAGQPAGARLHARCPPVPTGGCWPCCRARTSSSRTISWATSSTSGNDRPFRTDVPLHRVRAPTAGQRHARLRAPWGSRPSSDRVVADHLRAARTRGPRSLLAVSSRFAPAAPAQDRATDQMLKFHQSRVARRSRRSARPQPAGRAPTCRRPAKAATSPTTASPRRRPAARWRSCPAGLGGGRADQLAARPPGPARVHRGPRPARARRSTSDPGEAAPARGRRRRAASSSASTSRPRRPTRASRASTGRAGADSRLAYLQFLSGDTAGAIASMQRAVDGDPSPSPRGRAGRLGARPARRPATSMWVTSPAPRPPIGALPPPPAITARMAGLPACARPRVGSATRSSSTAGARRHSPARVRRRARRRLHARLGRTAEARRQYDARRVHRPAERAQPDRVQPRAGALLRRPRPCGRPRRSTLARRELQVRRDVYTYDVLAWALYQTAARGEAGAADGRGAAARHAATRACSSTPG